MNSLNNVASSASGNATGVLSNSVVGLQTIVNANNFSISANTLTSYNGSNIKVSANLNLSNSGVYFNNNVGLSSNAVNGISHLAFQTNGIERARLTTSSFGIGTKAPLATLDVGGDALVRGSLYVSTMGNIYADGSLYAGGVYYPSDPSLKTNIAPFVSNGLPAPVRFTWKATGLEDIGVLADDVARIEPSCVSQRGAIQTVDYSKLVVLCLAEIHSLRSTVESLMTERHR